MVTSTVLLIIFLAFLILQSSFYNSNSFIQEVPWASYDKSLTSIRIIIQLVISIGFVFDKAGHYRWEVNLSCFAIQSFIVFRRYQSAIYFNSSVLYLTIIYETVSMWLYLTVSIHIFSNSNLSACTLTLLFLAGLFLGLIMVYLQRSKMKSYFMCTETFKFETPLQYMIYLQRLYT